MRIGTTLQEYISLLEEKCLSLLIVKNNETVFKSSAHGIMPLLEAIERIDADKLSGSLVLDSVVGKAGALLICRFNAGSVRAKTISKPAAELFKRYKIGFETESLVEMIKGKGPADSCPFEQAVLNIDDPEEGYRRLLTLAHPFVSEQG